MSIYPSILRNIVWLLYHGAQLRLQAHPRSYWLLEQLKSLLLQLHIKVRVTAIPLLSVSEIEVLKLAGDRLTWVAVTSLQIYPKCCTSLSAGNWNVYKTRQISRLFCHEVEMDALLLLVVYMRERSWRPVKWCNKGVEETCSRSQVS